MDIERRRDARTHELIGAGFEVHREVGPGFGEAVCRDAFAVELHLRGIPFQTEVPFRVIYKGHRLPSLYPADFVCYDSVIVEIKSLSVRTGAVEQAQMLRYLRCSDKQVAAPELWPPQPRVSAVRHGTSATVRRTPASPVAVGRNREAATR